MLRDTPSFSVEGAGGIVEMSNAGDTGEDELGHTQLNLQAGECLCNIQVEEPWDTRAGRKVRSGTEELG